ncbi:MAG TPA: hypothetical protein DHW84_07710 [Firmicutes bacterium]|nr:hypothetical protein [Bacillota bacterium]HCM18101.1 hypothetical protein [Bacillota bacterium]
MAMKLESDLYLPVKQFLEQQGYEVKGEVKSCDLMAVRDEAILIVELKLHFNLTLVLQGVERQKLTPNVYLAIERPRQTFSKKWRQVIGLCRRLGLGLLTVAGSGAHEVRVVCEPEPFHPRINYRRRKMLNAEFAGRTGDVNTGGVNRQPVMTAYKEEAIRIATFLRRNGPSRLKDIREEADSRKAASILQKNFYGWFVRETHGIYNLTAAGQAALAEMHPTQEQCSTQ